MSTLTHIECDYCGHAAFNGAALVATADEARDELKDCGWLRIDEKDKCKWCVKGVTPPVRTGGSQKTATSTALNCTSDIIPLEDTQMEESEDSSLVQERRLSCAPQPLTPSSSGDTSSMTVARTELTALSSVTKDAAYHRASSDKRIRLLIDSGLIAGITPTSIRRRSPQLILDIALSQPVGGDAGEPREAS